MADMVEQQFWFVLPYELVADLPQLHISPMGVVPQRERRDRPIVDFSFSGPFTDNVEAGSTSNSEKPFSLKMVCHSLPRLG